MTDATSNPALIAHLETRRSVAAAQLVSPAPGAQTLERMLAIAVRVPDHGKLAPWRFVVCDPKNRAVLADRLMTIWRAANPDASAAAESVERGKREAAPMVVAVISRAAPHPKIPEWEQLLSAGAVCLNLLHAVCAFGFAAQWLTGWPAYDADAAALLGLDEGERVAGFVHIGTPAEAPAERERPDVAAVTTRWRG